eukprot:8224933-Alexandrium_andersonii.AAC.1
MSAVVALAMLMKAAAVTRRRGADGRHRATAHVTVPEDERGHLLADQACLQGRACAQARLQGLSLRALPRVNLHALADEAGHAREVVPHEAAAALPVLPPRALDAVAHDAALQALVGDALRVLADEAPQALHVLGADAREAL